MHYYKNKKDLTLGICYSAKEFIELLLAEKELLIFKHFVDRVPNIEELVLADAQKTANSRDYEYYVALFDFLELFGEDCNFCFNLKEKFNPSKDTIDTLAQLRKHTNDPPDIIVKNEGVLMDFELKRYRGSLDAASVASFVQSALLTQYTTRMNYLILLQSKDTELNPEIFEHVHKSIKQSKKDIGVIAFSFNANNEESIIVQVWPEFFQHQRTLNSGSEIVNKIMGCACTHRDSLFPIHAFIRSLLPVFFTN